ncbi:MAG TPA: rhomboid family intramembrane serine protease [Geminicoccaceae bacterium]|jgi:membrane associated rhomboid family serine protease|nr:rhomboid family intramembrane serine protease [Geminicoccaceae bacterium]
MIPIHDNNPTHRWPIVTVALIVTCVLVFFWQASLGSRAGAAAVYSFGFIPALLFTDASLPPELAVVPAGATLFTSMFLHGGFMHLAGNMLYLWVFGNNIEDVCGHARFVVFYLLCGVAAAFAQALPNPTSEVPMIGASGAISGVLGAYLLLFPHARVYVLVPFWIAWVQEIPAGWLLGVWVVFQLLSGVAAGSAEAGVAWWAHIGGFAAGMALIFVFRDRRFEVGGGRRASIRGRSRIPPTRPGPWS